MKNKISYLFRILIGVLILFFLFRSINTAAAFTLFRNLNIFWLSLAFSFILSIRVLMSIRWQYILRTQNLDISLGELIRITFIGMSFGQILPSGLGSDIVKGYQLIVKYGNIGDISATIVIDRFIGVFSMAFLAFLCGIIAKYIGTSINIIKYLIALQVLIIVGWIFIYIIRQKLEELKIFRNQKFYNIWLKIVSLLFMITNIQKIKKIFLQIFSISLLIQIIRSLIFYFIFRSFDVSLGVIYFLIYIPIVFIIILLPISIAGLGVRETSLIYFFARLGVSKEVCISTGITFLLLQIFAAAPGIILWIGDRKTN